MAVNSSSLANDDASCTACEMHVRPVTWIFLISFSSLESRFMISWIGRRWKWTWQSPSDEYEIKVTSRSYWLYSSSVNSLRSVSLRSSRYEYIEPERSMMRMLWATDFSLGGFFGLSSSTRST